MGAGMKRCVTCGEWKDETEFNFRYKVLGIRHPTCRECHRGFRSRWYENHKEDALVRVKERKHNKRDAAREDVYEYLSTHPCTSCGESDPRVLEFHHVGDKERTVSFLVLGGYTIKKIQAEIARCTVLCSNCHRRLTVDERGWFRGTK
jgi:hypothetical protein